MDGSGEQHHDCRCSLSIGAGIEYGATNSWEEIMKNAIALWVIAAGLLLSAAGLATAQDMTTQNPSANDTHSNVRTLTGCLRQGDNAHEFELMGQDGSTWELRSDAVDLA